jgi:TolB-like protein
LSFFSELRRRQVFRVAGLYAVTAWLLVQIAETLLPIFHTPEWVLQTLVILLALGFIPALIIAWVFELTPEGFKRDDGEARTGPAASQAAQRMDRLLLVGFVAVAALVIVDRVWLETPSAAIVVAGDPAAAAEDSSPPLAVDKASPPLERGIAVLPFANLSPDPDNAFFAGGIYEEVMTRLARLGNLRIISRTSMERIAEEKLEISAIGQRLGVSHVLEGSVRRAGDQVRVTVQLIEAANDQHLWAESYDRGLDDVFAIQSEIALAIADQLKLVLSASEQSSLTERPTDNAEAYDLYLRALEERRRWRGAAGFEAIIELLERAIVLDPDFIDAVSRLAGAHGRLVRAGKDDSGVHKARAQALLAEMQRRWPAHFSTRWAEADYAYGVESDVAKALALYRSLFAEQPNHAELALNIAASLKHLGRYEEFLEAVIVAERLDPESHSISAEKVVALGYAGRTREALALSDQLLKMTPDEAQAQQMNALGWLYFGGDRSRVLALGEQIPGALYELALFCEGNIDAAVAVREAKAAKEQGLDAAASRNFGAALQRLAGRDEEGLAMARETLRDAEASANGRELSPVEMATLARIAAVAGQSERARAWMDRATEGQGTPETWSAGLRGETTWALRWMGDLEGAWRLQLTELPPRGIITRGTLIGLQPFYDAMYGESAEYRVYMAGLEGEGQGSP